MHIYIESIRVHRWAQVPKKYISSKRQGTYALKNIQVVPLACKQSSLTKDGACWPCYNDQRHFPNAEKA